MFNICKCNSSRGNKSFEKLVVVPLYNPTSILFSSRNSYCLVVGVTLLYRSIICGVLYISVILFSCEAMRHMMIHQSHSYSANDFVRMWICCALTFLRRMFADRIINLYIDVPPIPPCIQVSSWEEVDMKHPICFLSY